MTLAPLLNASPIIQIHAFAGMGALALGAIQIALPKGKISHRKLGWVWLGLIMTMLLTAPVIHGVDLRSLLSPSACYEPTKSFYWNLRCASIHLITVYLLLAVPFAPMLARQGYIKHHRAMMIGLWVGALVIAGAFTMDTHRIMHAVVFGSSSQSAVKATGKDLPGS